MARVLPIDPSNPDPAVIAEAVAVLEGGGLVAFPTETVYGLGARGLHAADVARIFTAKGRPTGHPLILHVDGEAMARTVAAEFPDTAVKLAAAFWPGPLTIVVPRGDRVPPEASGGLPTVGLRSPAHPVALALIRAAREPLAAPSANAHMHVSPTTAAHVVRSLGDRVDLVLDGGPCTHGIESTVVTTTSDPPCVLRPGAISLERLRAVVGDVAYEAVAIDGDASRASPGMAAKHYAPRVRVVLVPRSSRADQVVRAIGEARGRGERVAAIVVTPDAQVAAVRCSPRLVLPDSPEGYAHAIFAALHAVDAAEVDVVVIENVPSDPAWLAVADRLSRAARA